jgi:glycerophosphoryl diester phosphodiesterase
VVIETDTRMTKDGVIAIAHDEDFKRLCGVDRKVKDTKSDEFPKMKSDFLKIDFGGLYRVKPND